MMQDYIDAMNARLAAHNFHEDEKRDEAAGAQQKALEEARAYVWNLGLAERIGG